MAKYSEWERWFIAKCYAAGMPYTDYAAIAGRLKLNVASESVYDFMRDALQNRTPEEMGATAPPAKDPFICC